MNRTGLVIALAVGAVTGLVFGFFPQLDLKISGLFFDPETRQFMLLHQVLLGRVSWPAHLRDASMWIVAAPAVLAGIALAAKCVVPTTHMRVPGRAIVFLLASLALAPGRMVNVALKEHWDRPRPIAVREFNGPDRFVPWWDPRGACGHNCSFVAGEASGAFWTLAPAALAPGPLRLLAYAAATPAEFRLCGGDRLRQRRRNLAHDVRRAFLHRRGVRGRVHVPDRLARSCRAVSLAENGDLRRRDRARDRARLHAAPRRAPPVRGAVFRARAARRPASRRQLIASLARQGVVPIVRAAQAKPFFVTDLVMKRGSVNKVVLAYSGGLDTSIILKWLETTYGREVVTFTADLGQGQELEPARQKALLLGVKPHNIFIEDLREEFVREYVFPMFRANALYGGQYLLGNASVRPLIAKKQIEIAEKVGADAVAHGATGKGNDQVRFELSYYALKPDVKVIAPWREWDLTSRTSLIAFAEQHQIPIAKDKRGEAPFSVDANLLHASSEGKVLEDPAQQVPDHVYSRTVDPENAPDRPTYVTIEFARGDAVAADGKALSPAMLLARLNELGRANGIGRLDLVENRFVGMKSRGMYETPGGTILDRKSTRLN